MEHLPEYLTVAEYARVMRIDPKTVRRLLGTKKITGTKIGSQWRIPNPEFSRAGAGE